jgi:galactokinase
MTMHERLVSAGLSSHEADRKTALLDRTLRALEERGRRGRPTRSYYVPGRIEVLGKHTDYGGGRSLLCAAERGFVVSAQPRDDNRVEIVDVVQGVRGSFNLTRDQPECTHWQTYPSTVTRRIARNFAAPLAGLDLAFGSDIPRASGISSSTAFIIACFVAIADRNALETRPEWQAAIRSTEDVAAYLGAIENGGSFGPLAGDTGVGTLGGSQDHTAILCARPNRLVGYRFSPVTREAEVGLADRVFVVAASGITASKATETRDQYNRAVRTLATIEQLWCRHTGGPRTSLGRLIEEDPGTIERLRTLVGSQDDSGFPRTLLSNRLEQFLLEARTLVPEATAALAACDFARFGALVDESQRAAERWLDNQIPETVTLARDARRLGADAASAFGAGFGGSVWALVAASDAEPFRQAWRNAYTAACPGPARRAEFFITGAGPALLRL